ncbi:MAG: LPS assembly lipoprotein LptE [Gammaproteobacteria bacterium]|nr:LPS assembly lipoprotein LptE [Gammaproteobacteria bacterium]
MNELRLTRAAIFFAIAMVVMLAGCGFHLRGALQIQTILSPIAVTGLPQGSELVIELRRRIIAQGLQVTEDTAAAHTVITLGDEQSDRVVTSVGPDGRAREYRAQYAVSYGVTRDNDIRLETQKVVLSRDFAFVPGQVLAAGNEEASLQKEMQHEAAYTILRALEPLGHSVAPSKTP